MVDDGGSMIPNHVNILFYSPWNLASKKLTSRQVKGFTVRVNMFEVPDAFHVLAKTFGRSDLTLNYLPTLMTFSIQDDQLEIGMVDNVTGIYYELGS
jgi:hypothetical protein